MQKSVSKYYATLKGIAKHLTPITSTPTHIVSIYLVLLGSVVIIWRFFQLPNKSKR